MCWSVSSSGGCCLSFDGVSHISSKLTCLWHFVIQRQFFLFKRGYLHSITTSHCEGFSLGNAHPLCCILLLCLLKRGHLAWTFFFSPQFIILVVDSTDRERLAISKEELYRMLAHEVTHSTLPSMTIYDDNAGRWPGFSSTSIV